MTSSRVFADSNLDPRFRAGLVGHWVGGGSGLTWFDRSGYGQHLSLAGGTQWTLRYAPALFFDGVDGRASAPCRVSITSTVTSVSMWVRIAAYPQANPRVIELSDGAYSLQIVRDGGSAQLVTKHSQFQIGSASTQWGIPPVGRWLHLVVIVDSSAGNSSLWLDAVSQSGSAGPSTGAGGGANSLYVGVRSDLQATTWFNGALEDLRIYNRALSSAEISTLANPAYSPIIGGGLICGL